MELVDWTDAGRYKINYRLLTSGTETRPAAACDPRSKVDRNTLCSVAARSVPSTVCLRAFYEPSITRSASFSLAVSHVRGPNEAGI
jgi:hypothetical protein